MRIVKLRTSRGVEGLTKAGQIIDVTSHRAKELVDRGLARLAEKGETEQRLGKPLKTAAPAAGGKKAVRPLSPPAPTGTRTGKKK